MQIPRWIKWSAVAITLSTTAFVAVVGVAHTPWGRPLLGYLSFLGMSGQNAGCPIGAGVDPEVASRLRTQTLDPMRGATASPTRRVLAFELGQSGRADVLAWAQQRGLECGAPARANTTSTALRCTGLDLDGTDATATVHFAFDVEDRLLDVERSARVGDVDAAVELASAFERDIAGSLGTAAASRRGEPTAGYLARGPLSQSTVEFRFDDMRAQVIVTNMGSGAYSIRDLHQALDTKP